MSNCCNISGAFLTANQARLLATDNKIVYSEICAIQQAIIDATSQCTVDGGKFCTTLGGATPMTYISNILSVDILAGGLNYFPVVPTATFYHPDSIFDGTVADADVTVVTSNGIVTGFTVNDGGSDYTPIIATVSGIATVLGSGADLQLNVVDGAIDSVTIINSGSLYANGEVVGVSHPTGAGAVLQISQTSSPTGGILVVDVIEGGSGYAPILPSVEITHPDGINFSGVVQVDGTGVVTGVSIQNGGVGYFDLLPTLEIDDVTGHGADILFAVDSGTGEILSTTVVDGGTGYTSAATGTVIPAETSTGAGATVDITVDANPHGTDPDAYYTAWLEAEDNSPLYNQIIQVVSYFKQLGYSIKVEVNPDTGSTIRWNICW